jgi:hypothetical protein
MAPCLGFGAAAQQHRPGVDAHAHAEHRALQLRLHLLLHGRPPCR